MLNDENFDGNIGYTSGSVSTFTLNGIKYIITGTAGMYANGIVAGFDAPYMSSGVGDGVLRFDSGNLFGISSIRIEASDGSAFRLAGLSFDVQADASFTITPSGGSAVSFVSNGSAVNEQNWDLSANNQFYNITSFTLAGGNMVLDLDDLNFEPAVSPNAAPIIGNLNGDSVGWAGVGSAVTLDSGVYATASDVELDALNSGLGDWAGATLTVQRAGAAVSTDVLGFSTLGGAFTVSGSNLQSGGQTFATFTSTGGTLTVNFTSSGTAAATALVEQVLRSVTYRNDTPAGDATLRFALSDGVSTPATADVVVTSDMIYVTNTTDTATINVANGVSFSEAVAIAAADGTGSQTLVLTSSFNSTMSLAGNLAIAESLSISANSADGLNISGSTITLGGGTTLRFVNTMGTATISSTLAGTGALVKEGGGTLVLANTGNEANMSGGITVNAGTLQISDDNHLSSGTLTLNGGTLANNSAAFTIDNAVAISASGGTFNISGGATTVGLSGVISGSGTLAKTGTSILQLDGSNTFTGAMNIGAGTVVANHANAFGTTAGSTTVAAGATLRVAGGLTIAENFSVAGLGTTVSGTEYGALHLVSGSSTLSGNVNVTGYTRVGADSGATLTLSGVLGGGAYILDKTGAGTLVLSNTGNEAASVGDITVTAGTLQISDDDQLSSGTLRLNGGTLAISGATTIDNAVVLASDSTISTSVNATLSGALSDIGTLNKVGASTLTLAGSSSGHFGAVNVTAGGLALSGGTALGDTSAVTLSGGTTLTVASTETIGSLAGAGNATLNAMLTAGGNNTSTLYSGVMSGSFGLTKAGSGTLTLTGNNTYSGDTTVTAGTLQLNRVGGALNDTTAVTVASGATLSVLADETVGRLSGAGTVALNSYELVVGATGQNSTFSGSVTGSGSLVLNGGTFTLSGSNSGQSWGTQVRGGSTLSIAEDANLGAGAVQLNNGVLAVTGNATVDNAIVLQGAGGVQVDTGLAATLSGVVSGGGSALHKLGSGTLVLSGSNTYTGATNVATGSLLVQGALAGTTGIEVDSGARLGGDGVLFATGSAHTVDVQNLATLAAGSSADAAGALTINGGLYLAGGSTLEAQINGAASGTGYDTVVVKGTVNLSSATLAVTVGGGYTPVNGAVHTLIDNQGLGAIAGTFTGIAQGAVITVSGVRMQVSYVGGDGNDLTLTALVNDAPTVAHAIGNQVATEDAAFSFTFAAGTFADADAGDVLTYSGQLAGGGTLPSWLSFDGGTRTFSGTPTNGDVGTISIEVTADDGNGGTVTDTFDIVVANTNDAPTVANPIADQGATEDAAFNFQFAANTFHDVDVGDTLTYSAGLSGGGALPSWLSFDGGTRTFSGTPTNGDVGTLTITVTAADGNGGTVADTFILTVDNTNDAPTVANPIADRSATASVAFSYVLPANTFHDVDVGDTLVYSAQLAGGGALPSWLVFNPATGTFSGIPGSADVGTLSVEVTATDSQNATVSDSFDIVVGAAPVIPTPQPEPEPEQPTPPVTPGVPDNDGIPAAVEDQAPGIPGPDGRVVQGDGNGDGIKDSEQSGVASVGFDVAGASPSFTTLVASSVGGKVVSGNDNARITSLVQLGAPEHVPEGMQMPIGLVNFTVELAQGKTGENFSLYLDPLLGVNGYWKQDAHGTWVNLASEPYGGKMVLEGGRVRLDFHIEDGGQFDADGQADGIITDPGAPAHLPLSITGLAPDLPQGFWF